MIAAEPKKITKYQLYPEYKDSGVEWVGDMPRHWQSKPAFAVVMDECIKNSDGAESNVLSLSYGNIVERDVETNFGLLPESFNTYQIVNPGDIILRLTDLQNDKRSLRVGRSTLQGIITSAYLKLSCSGELNDRYAYRLLHSYDTTKVFYGMGGGLRQSMKFEDFRRLPFLVPPLEEQRTIAAFLDHETARIDRLIAQQQRLIELLKEKRQAVISHAVTKGLNPNAPMKDSGVEWLGQVPEHWVVSRIKNYAKIESGHTPSRQVEEYWIDCNIPWVSLNDSKTLKVVDYISDTFYKINELGMANSSAHLLPERAVVFTRDASIGLAAITTIPMAVSQHLIAWICNEKKVIPEFLLLIFYAMELEFERYTFGATIKTIGMDDVRSLTAGFPKIDEQKEIITWAFSTLGILKNVLQKAEEKICLLQERRTALITAAVTGKIDLRGWTPPVEEVAA
ncbi:MAG: restriction endonuclease subunit S [Aeromonadaceae bacterium]|jgi:type I restriction enzyme S subunit|uniref:restriction endonuclease subunit S n=1 Tax=Aeromonas rivipollensis TaxID=948519 RepID=UPI001B6E8E7F|nr:restriction endonuclease subunit S [Aeromonadaceae bacterium]MBP9569718.1 restriction endonuclease subunit S [Aeromonadaceae bacterium]